MPFEPTERFGNKYDMMMGKTFQVTIYAGLADRSFQKRGSWRIPRDSVTISLQEVWSQSRRWKQLWKEVYCRNDAGKSFRRFIKGMHRS